MSLESTDSIMLNQIKNISSNDEKFDLKFVRWWLSIDKSIPNNIDIDEAISIGGPNDWGIDFYFNDDTSKTIIWGQCKSSETFDYGATSVELESFGNSLQYLENCPSESNKIFQNKSEEFIDLGGRDANRKKIAYFVVAGRLGPEASELVKTKAFMNNFNNNHNSPVEVKIIQINDLRKMVTHPKTKDLKISFTDFPVIEKKDILTKKTSIIGFVRAKEILRAIETDDTIFDENVRQSLGKSTQSYTKMKETLENPNKKKQFWKFNNGITAVCDKLDKELFGDPPTYSIKNFKIVNGRQTTFCLQQNEQLVDDVSLRLTIHETVDEEERNLITIATNTQNKVTPSDLLSNETIMINLQKVCREKYPSYFFERQRKEFNTLEKNEKTKFAQFRKFDKDTAARCYLAYQVHPNDAMVSEDKLFDIDKEGYNYYKLVYNEKLRIKDLIVPNNFHEILNALMLKWKKESPGDPTLKYKILQKQIVRYFILYYIGKVMRELDSSIQQKIEDNLISIMSKLKSFSNFPPEFIERAESSYDFFILMFDNKKMRTWPRALFLKFNEQGMLDPDETYDDIDVRRVLIENIPKGRNQNSKNEPEKIDLVEVLDDGRAAIFNEMKRLHTVQSDPIKNALLKIAEMN